jgi:hypothetical protein
VVLENGENSRYCSEKARAFSSTSTSSGSLERGGQKRQHEVLQVQQVGAHLQKLKGQGRTSCMRWKQDRRMKTIREKNLMLVTP